MAHLCRTLVIGGALLVLGGCDVLPGVAPASTTECNGTEPALCDAVARAAVAEMNLVATGPITSVVLTQGDCARAAVANFRHELATASTCWKVAVTGERSYGGGIVALMPDGSIDTFWP